MFLREMAIVIATIAPVAELFVYLAILNKATWTKETVTSLASLGPTLAIAHIGSVIVSSTVPMVFGLESYHFAKMWIDESYSRTTNRPSPLQCVLSTSFYCAHCKSEDSVLL